MENGAMVTKRLPSGSLAQRAMRWLPGLSLILQLLPAIVAAKEVTYYYTDPSGTPLATTDASGNLTAIFDTSPFGRQVLGGPDQKIGFTGHVADPTGLVYMQARYFDPDSARFLSVDPERSPAGVPAAFSRFAYAAGNPFKYTDPTGRVIQLIENSRAPHASDHSMADFVASMKADPIGAALIQAAEASPNVHVLTPAGRGEGSQVIPNDNAQGRVQADGSNGKGTGTTVKIQLGTERVKISNTPGEAGDRKKVGETEKGVHEFVHVLDFDNGSTASKDAVDPATGNPAAEQPAVDVENAYRDMNGLKGHREVY